MAVTMVLFVLLFFKTGFTVLPGSPQTFGSSDPVPQPPLFVGHIFYSPLRHSTAINYSLIAYYIILP